MDKIKVFWKKVKRQGHKVKLFFCNGNVLSQGMYMYYVKALPLLVRKLWPRLKFFKRRSNVKVKVTRSKILLSMKRSCHKKYICNTKALTLLVKKVWPRLEFFKRRSNVKVKVTRSKILVPMERSYHKECTYVIWKPWLFWLGSYGQG